MFELVVYENEFEGKIYKHQDLLQGVPEKCFLQSHPCPLLWPASDLFSTHCIAYQKLTAFSQGFGSDLI